MLRPVCRARLASRRPVCDRASVAAAAMTPAAAADARATFAPVLSLCPDRPRAPARIGLKPWRASPAILPLPPADRMRDLDEVLDRILRVVVGMTLPSFDE